MSSILDERFSPDNVDARITEIQKKDPGFAALLSLIVPGLGQFTLGSPVFGIINIVASAIILGVAKVHPDYFGVLCLAYVVLAIQSAYYTYKDVKSRNE